ncbi:PREDICTED: probable ADP-ribosylation factor GTPase-activating protein AGD14 isoform X2 [Lupinus angustifolius]|uniref:probable ADP-ribosylation factor GTPase-activating protein AGD14 isoform X2 n=1 Tax=Lupinus angustifolius TaxID=3871 RepID=UPI00092E4935|nr:PREDICTED: probable ADP-ribosylation factor GTPase-activating protein AGD14 isoform X2 [Lupinus angustifolius]
MASRLKEDEKNERIIRGLLKLQHNRRCINCNSVGPQYVCTNFWTFICTNCSGMHREFTHRVKSISMAKFTSQEVSALQEGGNQRAKEIYFKEWDAQSHSFPDSSNVSRLRDFIKHVYVDRRFTGERTYDKASKTTVGDKDNSYENRRVEMDQGGPKSPTYERRYDDSSNSGGRSPGSDQESRKYGDYRRGSGYPSVVNDWRREDRRISEESQSPEQAKDLGSSRSPVARPVRDILGENVIPLRISEPPKANSGKAADGSALAQRTASSSSLASSKANPAPEDVKLQTIKSLIDFDADPEPPAAPAIPQAQQTTMPQPSVQPANPSDDNWASFDVAPGPKATTSPANINTLESVLSELSVPASSPAHVPEVQGAVPASSPGFNTVSPVINSGQWASFQDQQPLFPATASPSTTQQFTPPPVGGTVYNQPWNIPPTVQGHPSTPMPHAYHHASNPANEAVSNVVSQPSTVEVNPSGREALPEDLFTLNYSSFPAPVRGWQMGLPHGTGISMQYNNVPTASFPQPSKSTNPFDIGSEHTPDQAPTFPSMSSFQGALPSYPSYAWTPPPSSPYASNPHPQAQTHASAFGPRAYMGQQMPANMGHQMPVNMGQHMPTNIPIPRQQVGSFGADGTASGLSNPDQQLTGGSSTNPNPHPFPGGGNPFV